MKNLKAYLLGGFAGVVLAFAVPALANQVINDNLQVGGTIVSEGAIAGSSLVTIKAGGLAAFCTSKTAGFCIYVGSGVPTITAAQGSLYLRSDGSTTATRAYINSDGATTWVAVTTAS